MKIKSVTENVYEKIKNKTITECRHILIDKKNQKMLINKSPSIISSNCNGCTIAHDLGLRHNSQFVNLYLNSKDFIKYISNLDYYNSLPLTFTNLSEYNYPVGKVGDIYIYFVHYSTNEEAKNKWEERKKRIDKNNMFFMMTDRDECTKEDMENFDALPYKNKVIFTHEPHPEIKSAFYIKGFENDNQIGELNRYVSKRSIYKWYDQFDYVEWFNTGEIRDRKFK